MKPSFFQDIELIELSILHRLLFIGLWCWSDREGRLWDKPRQIKFDILPMEDCDIDQLLTDLASKNFIQRYECNGKQCIAVTNFHKHQNPHYKELPSVIPPPDGVADIYQAMPVPESQRKRIFQRDNFKCKLCSSKESLTIDHIIERCDGGTSADDNLRTLCLSCNCKRPNKRKQDTFYDTAMIDESLIYDSDTKSVLIPDSFNLIPDSLNLKPSAVEKTSSEEQNYLSKKTTFEEVAISRNKRKGKWSARDRGRAQELWRSEFEELPVEEVLDILESLLNGPQYHRNIPGRIVKPSEDVRYTKQVNNGLNRALSDSWKLDNSYTKLKQLHDSTGAVSIDSDWARGHPLWNALTVEDKNKSYTHIINVDVEYMPRIYNYLDRREFERPPRLKPKSAFQKALEQA